jgi:hypothetical protein
MEREAMAIKPTANQAATYDDAIEAGFWGSTVEVLPADAHTVDGVVNGPDVTDDAYAEQRTAEANPPDISTLSTSSSSKSSSSSSSSKASSGSSSSGSSSKASSS